MSYNRPLTSPKPWDPKPSFLVSPYRRRRIIWTLFLLFLTFVFGYLFYGSPSPHVRSALKKQVSKPPVGEIYGLFHMVMRADEPMLSALPAGGALEGSAYMAGEGKVDWFAERERIDEEFPVIVFSKTYCPYSRATKQLLAEYNLTPPPKIIEVDLRSDQSIMKPLLTRLTGRGTVPNILVKGRPIGGNDDLQALHREGKLSAIWQSAGVREWDLSKNM